MGSWLWEKTVSRLSIPSVVISPRIPHNTKEYRLSISFDEVVAYHKEIILSKEWDSLVIVGHSGAGLLAGTLGKQILGVKEVIFVAANIPKNGTTALDVFPEEVRRKTVEALQKQAEYDQIPIRSMEEFFINTFAHGCSVEDQLFIKEQFFFPEPVCVVREKMDWDNYPDIKMKYILCKKDRSLSLDQQRLLASNLGIQDMVVLDTDHLPMISSPGAFMGILETAVKD